jgi:hypothetical protein
MGNAGLFEAEYMEPRPEEIDYCRATSMTSLHTQFPRLHDEPAFGTGWPAHPTHGMARLSLFINGTAYHVRPLSTDALTAIKAFRLRKFDGTEYDIAQTVHGITCDCPAFTFKREGIDPEGCKHIKALVACGLIEPKPGEVPAAESTLGTPSHREKEATDQTVPTATIKGQTQSVVPANGQPTTFLETVEHEALGYRAWGTTVGGFLADQLGRIAQLIRWTGARTPEDHDDRMEIYDRELRDRYYEQGYQDGLEAGRREACPCRHGLD